jgi:hypothetical protein
MFSDQRGAGFPRVFQDTVDMGAVERAAGLQLFWTDPDPIDFGTRLSEVQLNATANVAGQFSYVPPIGVLLLAGEDQTLSVTFMPDDTVNYSAVSTTVRIDVIKADPAILWNRPVEIVVGTPLGEAQLNATANTSGQFQYDPPAGTVLDVGEEQVLSTTFVPVDTANFNVVVATTTIDVIESQDFGDAPAGYPVTLADDGARHGLSSLFLGSQVDGEQDGQSSPQADADNDDGVTAIASFVAAEGSETLSSLRVRTSAAGKLDGWFDFNQDGDWDDPGEQVLGGVELLAGDNVISLTIPAASLSGNTFARFRISTAGGLAPTGGAADGEVEDYLTEILDGAQKPVVSIDPAGRSLTIAIDAPTLSVRDAAGVDRFVSPQSDVGQLVVNGTGAREVFTLVLSPGSVLPPDGLDLRGGGGNDTLVLEGDDSVLDLTDPQLLLRELAAVDVSGSDVSTLLLDGDVIERLSPQQATLLIVAGSGDLITVTDANDWLMADPIRLGNRFLLTANRVAGRPATIQLETPNVWQNLLLKGDVNGDGIVTGGDALRIVNELGRRSFSDPETRALLAPTDVAVWPGLYFDHNGDGRASALDALRVINDLTRQSLAAADSAESLWAPADSGSPSGIVVPIVVEPPRSQPQASKPAAVFGSDAEASGGDVHSLAKLRTTTIGRRDTDPGSLEPASVDLLLADASALDQLIGSDQ